MKKYYLCYGSGDYEYDKSIIEHNINTTKYTMLWRSKHPDWETINITKQSAHSWMGKTPQNTDGYAYDEIKSLKKATDLMKTYDFVDNL